MADLGDYPLWAVVDAIATGKSATQGLAEFRDAGGETRTQTWYRAYGEAQAALAGREAEVSAPLGRAPTPDEMTTWSTVNATGVLHQVEVFVRDHDTGEVVAKPWSVVSAEPLTRGEAIASALHTYDTFADDYAESVLFAVHVGAFAMEPTG